MDTMADVLSRVTVHTVLELANATWPVHGMGLVGKKSQWDAVPEFKKSDAMMLMPACDAVCLSRNCW